MSVRAYRVEVEAVTASDATFNLWSEPEVYDFLMDLESTWHCMDDGSGQFEVYLSELEPALKDAKISKEAKKALKHDIELAKAAKMDYIKYECF